MTPDEVIGFVRRDRQTEDQDELDRQRNQQRRSHKTPRMITHLRGAPASRRRARGRDRRDLPILQDAPQSTLAAPPLKIGSAMLGLKAHANAPALNSPESAALAIPYWPVKEMLGKNAARAAP